MTIIKLLKYVWNGVDIPITKDDIQHAVNVAVWDLKNEIKNHKGIQELNNQYKISCYDDGKKHKTLKNNNFN